MNISKHNLIQIQDLQKEIEENDDLEKIKLQFSKIVFEKLQLLN